MVRKISVIIFILIVCSACEFKLQPSHGADSNDVIEVCRYDRLESRYLTTGDFSALQQMETGYPMETRTLIENVLRLGLVNDPDINNKFLTYFQDSTLQVLISDAEAEYANMDDINSQFNSAFTSLKKHLPDIKVPKIYAQISALDQSIVVGDETIGISLDKYLGENYLLYKKYYNLQQRKSMNRSNIVPDCLNFYLLSLYPMQNYETRSQLDRDLHMGKVMWLCNQVMGNKFFNTKYVDMVGHYMSKHKDITTAVLMEMDDYSVFGS